MKRFSPLAFTFLLISACGGTDDGSSVEGASSANDSSDNSGTQQPAPSGGKTAPADNKPHAVALSVSASPSTGGSVTVDPPAPYAIGDTVHISATATSGYQFDGWIGADTQAADFTLTLSENTELAAQFSRIPANVNVSAQPAAGATVTVTPPGPHYVGDTVTVNVAAQPGYVIQQWSDGSGNATSRTLNLTGDIDVHVTLVAVPVAGGPDTHVGNESDYTLSWTYIWDHIAPLSGYAIEESYDNGPFVAFDTVSTSGTEITVTIPVTRAPATHCYRVRAHLGSFYSPYSNSHCVQRIAGQKRVMIINDIAAWAPGGRNLNNIASVTASGGSGSNMLAANNVIATGGGSRSFDLSGEPANYSLEFDAGYWDASIGTVASWVAHTTQVVGCDTHTAVYKAQIINITNHTYDTVFIHTSYWLPVGNYGQCIGTQCVVDPVCSH